MSNIKSKKISKTKLPIILGLISAFLNFIFPGHSFLLCAINPIQDFCSQAGMAYFLNWPTIQLLTAPVNFLNIQNEQLTLLIFAVSGLIQYFVLGYILGTIIKLIPKKIHANKQKTTN